MKLSEEALALRQKRDKAIRASYDELLKNPKLSQAQIYHLLSEQYFLLERQLYRIICHHG